jgi:hypothetical protein
MRTVGNTHESFHREETVQGSSDRTLGLVFAVFFLLVTLLPLVRGRPARMWALIPAGAFLIAALLLPGILHPLNIVWTRLGLLLHRITNPIILGVLFYVVFMPFGLVVRLVGKDLLRLRWDPQADSYWIPRDPPGPPPESMAKQF